MKTLNANLLEPCAVKVARTVLRGERGGDASDLLDYSAIQAEVPDPTDPSTQINTGLIQSLMQADLIAVAGEAGSHCVANTVRDVANNFGDDSFVSKLVLLTDATCPVTGFEAFQDDFIREMTARGMQLSTTTDFLA